VMGTTTSGIGLLSHGRLWDVPRCTNCLTAQ
jgi:hypothetical protein